MDYASILKLLSGTGTSELSKKSGANDSVVSSLLTDALPVILGAMTNNAKDEKGASSLSKALDDHAGADISNLGSFLQNVDLADGAKILGHVFGSKQDTVKEGLAKKNGLDIEQVGTILGTLAPLVLTYLGQEKNNATTKKTTKASTSKTTKKTTTKKTTTKKTTKASSNEDTLALLSSFMEENDIDLMDLLKK